MKLLIRKETKKNEYRTPLIPQDCAELIKKGYTIYIEHCDNRCFQTREYVKNGCILVNSIPEDCVIIGLKELDMNSNFFKYKNIYFSHCFKNQKNSDIILKKFKEKGGKILDYEYIVDEKNKRRIAFGFWAGFVGMYLGLYQYIRKINNLEDIKNINSSNNYQSFINQLSGIPINANIAIIGINGRCGSGCSYLLNKLGLDYSGFTRDSSLNLSKYDIIVNCIFLSPESNITIIDKDYNLKNLKVIVDISCDINAENNPIKIPYNTTDFYNPICKYKDIDIIAIDNLPALLPNDSSKEFSNKLINLLQEKNIWENLEKLYDDKIKNI